MTRLLMRQGGELTLPASLCQRYGLTPDVPIRVIELAPDSFWYRLPMHRWTQFWKLRFQNGKSCAACTWDSFPFDDGAP
jgi:hypothetical protein